MQSKDIKTKIVLLGDTSVGKSSILKRLKFDSFDMSLESTIGCEFFAKEFKIDENTVKLLIWDTAGQEVFRTFTPNFLRGAKIIIIVYSVAFRQSFLSLESWIEEAQKIKNSSIVLVGSKCDLKSEINENELKKFENIENLYFFGNVSAKRDINIKELFIYISELCVKKNYGQEKKNIVDLNNNQLIKKNSCC